MHGAGRLDRGYDWQPAEHVLAVAFDTPVVGWRGTRVNTLRLWSAQPIDPILLDTFNAGDHIGALAREQQGRSADPRALSRRFARRPGQELRLRQEYLLLLRLAAGHRAPPSAAVSATSTSLPRQGRDPAQRHASGHRRRRADAPSDRRPRHRVRRRPGTSPAAPSATPTTRCCPRRSKAGRCRCSSGCCRATCRSSTPSTPRCCSRRATQGSFDDQQIANVSLIDESGERRVRMGNLAFVGSHSVNGVSALHTELMKETVFADLHKLYPDRINNKTNGITPRRWLHAVQSRPDRADPRARSATDFLDDADQLTQLDALCRRCRPSRSSSPRSSAPTRCALANLIKRAAGHHGSTRRAVRRPGQAHPRIQAPAAQHHRDGRALRPDPLASRARLGAARQALRRQGGAELSERQADHQADQRRRQA